MTGSDQPGEDRQTRIGRRKFLVSVSALTTAGALASCSGPKQKRPPPQAQTSKSAIPVLGAVDLAAAIASGELSATEAAMRTIRAAAAHNPEINGLAFADFERASLAQDLPVGPFTGVPFAIKDLSDWPGMPTSFGSRAFKNSPVHGQRLTPFLAAVRALGINPIGKSTTPEFGLTATTEPLLTGPTRNPVNPACSAGGSSGGAAALVAAGILPFAHATDGGGSIRIPAACCGLVGLKPSWGRFPTEGGARRPRRMEELSVPGVLTRNVRDTAHFFAAMENRGEDAALRPVGLIEGASDEKLRIGIALRSPAGASPDAETAEAILSIGKLLEKNGHRVDLVEGVLDDADLFKHFMVMWAAGAAQTLAEWSRSTGKAPDASGFEPWTLGLVAHYKANKTKMPDAHLAFERFEASWESRFTAHHLILTPVLASPAAPIGYLSPELPFETHLQRVTNYAGYTGGANAAGAPAIAVPVARAKSGLPIAAQFLAPVGGERRLIEMAFALEAEIGWAEWRPQIFAG